MGEALTDAEFQKIRSYIYKSLGHEVDDKKRETVTTKIYKIARRHGMSEAKDYLNYLYNSNDPEVVQEFLNEITTNTTEFFRESSHFDYIKNNINHIIESIPQIKRTGVLRAWSAPCSSGEEPITLAIVLKECLPAHINFKILATDIDTRILAKANRGRYTESECKGLTKQMMLKYFKKDAEGFYVIGEEIKKQISYRQFNLTDEYPFKHSFDMIFCRNLMIYMDNAVQEKLINLFYGHLVENGLFFIGHSESLLNKKHNYKYVSTAIYKK